MKPIHKCIDPGCENEAGGLYSSYWCSDHDEARQKRHEKELEEMKKLFRVPKARLPQGTLRLTLPLRQNPFPFHLR